MSHGCNNLFLAFADQANLKVSCICLGEKFTALALNQGKLLFQLPYGLGDVLNSRIMRERDFAGV